MISIVCSSIEPSEDFKKEVLKAFGHPKVEFLAYENKGTMSLTEVYNKGLEDSKYEIVVFIHDDIIFDSKQIAKKIQRHFDNNPEYGIIGVAGTKYLAETGRWWDDRKKMYGRVGHTHEGTSWLSTYSPDQGNDLEEVIIVDGVFFAAHKARIKVNFDHHVKGFHFYDVDFCFRNWLEDVKIGVHTNIKITHKSIGETNEAWERSRETFASKYAEDLPVKIDRVFDGSEKFRILIGAENINDVIDLVDKLRNKNHMVSVCSERDMKGELALKNKGARFFDFNGPPGYKMGDGQWGIDKPDGTIEVSEPKKYYKIKEVPFDILHMAKFEIANHLTRFYPDTPYISQEYDNQELEEVISEYQKTLT